MSHERILWAQRLNIFLDHSINMERNKIINVKLKESAIKINFLIDKLKITIEIERIIN